MALDDYLRRLHTIDGWCSELDARLLALFASAAGDGEVLEIGTFKGKSAIALGYGTDAPERVIVCDPILDPNHQPRSNRGDFESSYRRFHRCVPVIYTCFSDELGDFLDDGSVRFAHVDGSHDYDFVQRDVALTERLATTGGVIAFDDFNISEFPGVALATWEAVTRGFVPLVFGTTKMYGTWQGECWPQERVGDLLRDAGMDPRPHPFKDRAVYAPHALERSTLRMLRAITPPCVARRSALLTGMPRRHRKAWQ